jgi:glutaredoxin
VLHSLHFQVVVFSWSGCPFCKNAKALLADLGTDFTALELDTLGQEGKQIRAELAAVSHQELQEHTLQTQRSRCCTHIYIGATHCVAPLLFDNWGRAGRGECSAADMLGSAPGSA